MIDLFGDIPAADEPPDAEEPFLAAFATRGRPESPFPQPAAEPTVQPAAQDARFPPQSASFGCVLEAEPKTSRRPLKAPSLSTLLPAGEASSAMLAKASLEKPPERDESDEEARARAMEESDRLDEEAIVAHLRGGFLDRFVYEYCQDYQCSSKKNLWACPKQGGCSALVRDLSWWGIQEASRALMVTVAPGMAWRLISSDGKSVVTAQETSLADPGVVVMEYPDLVRVVVRAVDPSGLSRVGVAQQKKQQKFFKKGGASELREDEFFAQKAMSKAERNALRQLIPQLVMRAWIDSHLAEQRARALPAAAPPEPKPVKALAPSPPPERPLGYEGKLARILSLMKEHGPELYDYTLEKIRRRCPDDRTAGYVLQQWNAVEKRNEIVRWMTPDA